MKSTFVSIASHELRAPLNAILGYAEMLREGVFGSLADEQHDAVKRVLANTNQMMSLANNLLDRAQIEAGTLELNVADFSPAQTVAEAVSAMVSRFVAKRPSAPQKTVPFHVARPKPITASGRPDSIVKSLQRVIICMGINRVSAK